MDEEEYRYLQTNPDFMELMKNSKLDLSLIKSSDESKKESLRISEKLYPQKNESPSKSAGKQRKSFRDMLFSSMREKPLDKIDENEELVIPKSRRNSMIKTRLRNVKIKKQTYENTIENKELLILNPIFLTATKDQEALYNEFEKAVMLKNTSKNNATMLILFFVTLFKLLISLGIRTQYFYDQALTFCLILAFLTMLLIFIVFKGKLIGKNKKYYTHILLIILIFGIQVIILENYYVKSDIFDKITLLHVMSIILCGSRLK